MFKAFNMVKFILILALFWIHWIQAETQTSMKIGQGYIDATTVSIITDMKQIKASNMGSCGVFCHSKIVKGQKCNIYYLDEENCHIGFLKDTTLISKKQGPILVNFMYGIITEKTQEIINAA